MRDTKPVDQGGRGRHGGGSDESEIATLAVFITSIILNRPTCLLCIIKIVGATHATVMRAMARIAETIQVIVDHDARECRACWNTHTPVYSLRQRVS